MTGCYVIIFVVRGVYVSVIVQKGKASAVISNIASNSKQEMRKRSISQQAEKRTYGSFTKVLRILFLYKTKYAVIIM